MFSTPQSLEEIQLAMKHGHLTCHTLVRSYLQKIEEHKLLNAYVEVFADESLNRAKKLDLDYQAGNRQDGKTLGCCIQY